MKNIIYRNVKVTSKMQTITDKKCNECKMYKILANITTTTKQLMIYYYYHDYYY